MAIHAYVPFIKEPGSKEEGRPFINILGPYIAAHERHFIQQSQYTVCTRKSGDRLVYANHKDAFNGESSKHNLLRTFIMPGELRIPILAKLDQMNINEHSLFRTVEGLMSSLALREMLIKELPGD